VQPQDVRTQPREDPGRRLEILCPLRKTAAFADKNHGKRLKGYKLIYCREQLPQKNLAISRALYPKIKSKPIFMVFPTIPAFSQPRLLYLFTRKAFPPPQQEVYSLG